MFDKKDIEEITAKLFNRNKSGILIDADMIPDKYLPKWYRKGMVSSDFDDEQDKEIFELCERFEEAVQEEWDRLLDEDEDDYQQYLEEQRNEYYTKLFSLEKI
jgi:hypothetical protein